MNRTLVIFLLLIQIPIFVFVSRSIVNVTLLQLRFHLTREKLLNYELSSQVLEHRFRRMLSSKTDDMSSEIKVNILESSILNFEQSEDDLTLTPVQHFGLWVVNSVRLLSFKRFLSLSEDQETLLMLQYAFYLERNRRYDLASEKYTEIAPRLEKTNEQDHGFVLLHNGYSMAMAGNRDGAMVQLQRLLDLYPDSHYSETANLLLNLLLEGEKASKEIEARFTSNKGKGVAYFQSGQFAEAVRNLEKAEREGKLTEQDKYLLGRSYEETGSIKDAVNRYIQLVNGGNDEEAVKKANRRLLMIGSFYGGGEKLTNYAKENARQLGDDEMVKEVDEGKELQLKPLVIEKIKEQVKKQKEEKAESEGENVEETAEQEQMETLEKLVEIQQDLEKTLEEEQQAIAAQVKKSEEEDARRLERLREEEERRKREEERRRRLEEERLQRMKEEERRRRSLEVDIPREMPKIYVEFIDGRRIVAESIGWDKNSIILKSGDFAISLPSTMVYKIGMDGSEELEKFYAVLYTFKKGETLDAHVYRKEGKIILFYLDGEEEERRNLTEEVTGAGIHLREEWVQKDANKDYHVSYDELMNYEQNN